jgi:cell division protein ZapB
MSDTIKSSDTLSADKSSPSARDRQGRDRQLAIELTRLAKRIDELVALVDALKDQNRALRQGHESLANERAALLHKNEQVRTRVEAMIGRLKTLEHSA